MWGVDAWRGKEKEKTGEVQFGGTVRLRERVVYQEEWLETRAQGIRKGGRLKMAGVGGGPGAGVLAVAANV